MISRFSTKKARQSRNDNFSTLLYQQSDIGSVLAGHQHTRRPDVGPTSSCSSDQRRADVYLARCQLQAVPQVMLAVHPTHSRCLADVRLTWRMSLQHLTIKKSKSSYHKFTQTCNSVIFYFM